MFVVSLPLLPLSFMLIASILEDHVTVKSRSGRVGGGGGGDSAVEWEKLICPAFALSKVRSNSITHITVLLLLPIFSPFHFYILVTAGLLPVMQKCIFCIISPKKASKDPLILSSEICPMAYRDIVSPRKENST